MVLDPAAVAIEEWKQLQEVIGRLEGLEFQVRGWLLALLGALAAALLSSHLKSLLFIVTSVLVIVTFCLMELLFRGAKRAAIDRGLVIEEYMQSPGQKSYNGPRIGHSLSIERTWRDDVTSIKSELVVTQVWSFYAALLVVVLALSLAGYGNISAKSDTCCCCATGK